MLDLSSDSDNPEYAEARAGLPREKSHLENRGEDVDAAWMKL